MKKASFVGLLMVGVVVLGIAPALFAGAYDELLPDAVKGKTFVPSIKVRFEYDDNIYTTTAAEKASLGLSEQDSWKFYLEPKIDVHWLSTASYVGLGYQPSFIWYTDREDDDTDVAHDVNVDLRHSFSPSVEVILQDFFRSSEEPQVAEDIVTAGGIRTIPLQRNGDYDYNRVTAGLNLKTGRLWWNWSYTNLWVDFDEPEVVVDAMGIRPGASYYFDRMSHIGAVKAQYLVTPQSKVNLGVTLTDTEYDSEALMKDSMSWIVYGGLDQDLTKTCVGSVLVGWENRDYDDIDLTNDSPFVDISLSSGLQRFGKRGYGRIGYRFAMDETDQSAYAFEEVHTIYAGLNADLAAGTSLHLNTSYEMGSYDSGDVVGGRASGDRDENVWLLGLVLRRYVTKDIYVEGGYRRTDVDSDFAGSDYDRNRYFVGVGGIF